MVDFIDMQCAGCGNSKAIRDNQCHLTGKIGQAGELAANSGIFHVNTKIITMIEPRPF